MSSVCLSSATILRCSYLTRTQKFLLFVPAALEFLTSTSLLYFKWRSGRIHLLLTAEGWSYFALALLEVLSVTPLFNQCTANSLRAIDMAIGIASSLPLFLYSFFLYLLMSRNLLTGMPTYVRNITKVVLFVSLPLIIAADEVASLVGVQLTFSSGLLTSFQFSTKHDELFWIIFTSLALAALTAFQAIVFSFSFFRFIWIFLQRSQEDSNIELLGVPWVSAGMKLGALESLLGFASGSFEISFARRIMRCVSRACLCIGVLAGVDSSVNSTSYNNLEKNSSRSRIRLMISNPRLSTFQELTPTATDFHSAPRATESAQERHQTFPTKLKVPHYSTHSQRHMLHPSGVAQFASIKEMSKNGQRVTVLYDNRGGPPLLHMRFSNLDVPSPSVLTPNDGKSSPAIAAAATTPRISEEVAPNDPDDDDEGSGDDTTPDHQQQVFSSTLTNLDPGSTDSLVAPIFPFFHDRQNSQGSSLSTHSIVEIVALPRRTISQRRAEAKVFRANSVKSKVAVVEGINGEGELKNPFIEPLAAARGDVSVIDSPSPSPSSDAHTHLRPRHSASAWKGGNLPSPPTRTTTGSSSGTSSPMTSLSRSDSKTTSTKSVADSIQAVHDLACQFPPLPPIATTPSASPSAVAREFKTSAASVQTIRNPSNNHSGAFIHSPAAGSSSVSEWMDDSPSPSSASTDDRMSGAYAVFYQPPPYDASSFHGSPSMAMAAPDSPPPTPLPPNPHYLHHSHRRHTPPPTPHPSPGRWGGMAFNPPAPQHMSRQSAIPLPSPLSQQVSGSHTLEGGGQR